MLASNRFKRVRGIAGNAVVWGLAWGAAALAVVTTIKLGNLRTLPALWSEELYLVRQFAWQGALVSAAFSTFMAVHYRGRRLADLSWKRVAIGGAVASAFLVPLAGALVRFLVWGEFSLSLTGAVVGGLTGAVFGGATAATTLKLAQRESLPPTSDTPRIDDRPFNDRLASTK